MKKCNYIFDFLTEQFLDLERRSINHEHESDHEYLLKSKENSWIPLKKWIPPQKVIKMKPEKNIHAWRELKLAINPQFQYITFKYSKSSTNQLVLHRTMVKLHIGKLQFIRFREYDRSTIETLYELQIKEKGLWLEFFKWRHCGVAIMTDLKESFIKLKTVLSRRLNFWYKYWDTTA